MDHTDAPGDAALLPGPDESPALSPFYRTVDWWTFAVTTLLVFIGYWLTLAPSVTLEDAGELTTAAIWTGVPTPPGYPIWTILTGLFIKLVPISNIAYRVSLASALEGALACGLVALMASRASSLMIDGISGLRDMDKSRQNPLCAVAGYVAGMTLGFSRYLWREAVVPEIYPLAALSLVVTLTVIFRWMYSPDQRRYIYWTAFLFGICVVNHQTLILAAMGLELAIIVGKPKLGRDVLAVNVACWILGLYDRWRRAIHLLDSVTPMVFVIFNIIGILSVAALAVLIFKTKRFGTEWKSVLTMVGLWLTGVGSYFCVAIASMTNPPMNWGYPRTVEGFFHTISRGQYDRINPEDFIHAPLTLIYQVFIYFSGVAGEFTLVYLLIALIPFAFFVKMRKRERGWMIVLCGVFAGVAVLLTDMFNPTRERQTSDLVERFYIPSLVPITIWIGCGFALAGAWFAVKFRQVRLRWLLLLFAAAPLVIVHRNWARSEQRGHMFGYWYGHDMFSPPFGLYPEMTRDAVLFGGTDPGRFCPTYMIFSEGFAPPEKRTDPRFDRRDVYMLTQNALADNTYLDYIRAQYNRSAQVDPPFFQNFWKGAFPRLSHEPEPPPKSYQQQTTDLIAQFNHVHAAPPGDKINESFASVQLPGENKIETP